MSCFLKSLFFILALMACWGCHSLGERSSNQSNFFKNESLNIAPEKVVAQAVSAISYDKRSKITYLSLILCKDTKITWSKAQVIPFFVREAGYLVWIDEAPDMDWEHRVKIMFVTLKNPKVPIILFDGDIFPSFSIESQAGVPIWGFGEWKSF
jgi:hypothetical protein